MIRKRWVRFDEKAKVCLLKRPSKDESKSLWYTKRELKRIRSGIKREIKSLSLADTSSESSEDASIQWRGLERLQTSKMRMMLDSQRALTRGVISMQELHKKLGLREDRAFALFVVGFSKEAAKRATKVAQRDFIEAQRVYREL